MACFRVGTSGWSYPDWRGRFYPTVLKPQEQLAFYARHFNTVEVNASFYRLPSEETLDNWRKTVPRDFKFSIKASRYITHVKHMADPKDPVGTFLRRARVLGSKLGPILFQLPPRFRSNPSRLANLVRFLPARRRFVFEFRDPSWINDEVREILERRGIGFCIFHMVGLSCPLWVTGPFVYLRFHGASGKYGGSYRGRDLARWAERVGAWLGEGRDVYAYFNNDLEGAAVRDGQKLAELVEEVTT
ncbi:MAG TPA: DUF72 domain-containing protein [Vicinamibacteria bacterium]